MSVFSIIVVIQVLAAIFGLITIVILCRQNASYFQKITTITAVCSFLGMLAYVFEILATNLEEALLATRFGYIGKSYAMVLFLIFIAGYCDVNLPKWGVNTLLTFSTVMLFVVLSCPYHNLYYSSIEFVDTGLFPHLVLGKGVLYYVFMIVTLGVMFVFMAISVTTLFKRKGEERRRLILLSLSGLLPAIGLTLNLFSFMQGFDPTPMGILAACCLVVYNVLHHGLLDTMQLARENVMDDTTAGLIVVSKTKSFVYANKMAYQIFPELKHESKNKDMLTSLFEGVSEDNTEKQIFNRNGVIYELNYSVLKENSTKSGIDNNGYIAWIFDKTKEYNYTKELERLREKAEEANRSKSIFLAKMSHEIRTPMNGIMGFADLALENNLDKETSEYLHYIKDSSNSLLSIINDVLDISKIESGKMEIIDVEYNPRKLFNEIITLFKSQAEEKNIEFITSIPSDMPYVLVGDAVRFREILVNILGNAVKYTKQGKIYFIVNVLSQEEEKITFEISVKDTGIGIKPDKLEKIFNIFEQADNVGNYNVEGTGLGLSIAKQLTELMGGSISVKSAYKVGSTFTIIIPQKYVSQSKQTVSFEESEYAIVTNNIKALLVDDNIINLKVEKGILERYGINVDVCESGEDCMDMVKKDKYDVIFMDQMMPGMDGVATMKAIRFGNTANVRTPILLVTANAIMGVEQDMLKAGFDGFVSKPINQKALEKELLKVLPSEKVDVIIPDKEQLELDSIMPYRVVEKLAKAGVNVDVGIKYCGDINTYEEVLRIAVAGFEDKIANIKAAYEAKDYENYRILVHALKSGAANVGALKLSDMAKELENAAKQSDIDYICSNTDVMLELYEDIITAIKDNLPAKKVAEEYVHTDKSVFLQGEWEEKLKDMEYLLSELEIDETQEMAKELLTYNINYECQVLLKEMIESLDGFDIEGAKARLVSLNSVDLF